MRRLLLIGMLTCGMVGPVTAAMVSLGLSGAPVAGFAFWQSGQRDGDHWSIVSDGAADDGVALELSGSGKDAGPYIAENLTETATNLKARLQFKLLRGQLPSGGLVLRMTNPGDYYLIKVSAYEERLSFIRVTNGVQNEIAGVDAQITQDHWQTLDVDAHDNQFTISLDGNWALTAFDRTAVHAGHVGLWSENDNVTRFGGIQITPHGDDRHAGLGANQTRGD